MHSPIFFFNSFHNNKSVSLLCFQQREKDRFLKLKKKKQQIKFYFQGYIFSFLFFPHSPLPFSNLLRRKGKKSYKVPWNSEITLDFFILLPNLVKTGQFSIPTPTSFLLSSTSFGHSFLLSPSI